MIGRVCWKSMSEMRVVCGKMPESCNVAVEMAKIRNKSRNNAEITRWMPRKVVRKVLEGIERL